MQEKKYELLPDDTKVVNGRTLYRIRALHEIQPQKRIPKICSSDIIKAGDLGGYIESEWNLSHDGLAWVGDEAMVYEDAQVYDDALVHGHAQVYGAAQVCGTATVTNYARVYLGAVIQGHAHITHHARVHGTAIVTSNPWCPDLR